LEEFSVSASTVSRALIRLGLGRKKRMVQAKFVANLFGVAA